LSERRMNLPLAFFAKPFLILFYRLSQE
jgi:hypothetical protein